MTSLIPPMIREPYKKPTNMNDLTQKIIEWARDKDISDEYAQMAKVTEEVGELAHALVRTDDPTNPELIDAIGDSLITIIILADICGIDPSEALQTAFDEVKSRKGEIVDGAFVKEDDL